MTKTPTDTWYYRDTEGTQVGPVTRAELEAAFAKGHLHENVYNPSFGGGFQDQGIPFHSLRKLDFQFDPPIDEFLRQRSNTSTTVLAGPNNVGKSLALKFLYASHGPGARLLGCSRFYHVDKLSTSSVWSENELYRNYSRQFYAEQQNTEQNQVQLSQVITRLTDAGRQRLFDLAGRILDAEFSIKWIDPANEFSERYIIINDERLAVSSTGTRLLLLLLGTCLQESITTLFIDEPEIGLSPATQSAVAAVLQDPSVRAEFLPHLRGLFLATHSHLFLDRSDLTNNFVMTKDGDHLSMLPVQSIAAFQDLQFAMLGNELESLFLPSAIVVVEGPTDYTFLSRYLRLFEWGQHVAVVRGHGDGGVLRKLNTVREVLGDLARSPYSSRVICVLDQRHSVRLDRIATAGVPAERCIVWSKNGIEHYYPRDVLRSIFSCSDEAIDAMAIGDDAVEINGIRKSKGELAELVAVGMTAGSEFGTELQRLDAVVQSACGHS